MRLLDTDILIDLGRGYPPALSWLASLRQDEAAIPGFVMLEFMDARGNVLEMWRLQRWLAPFHIYWSIPIDCDRALATFARGHPSHNLSLLDALIGECAVWLGVPLCTFNARHCRAIGVLAIEQPYERA